ncbi:MAG: hypothetical protein AB8B49_00450 [Nitratireductor sp.]
MKKFTIALSALTLTAALTGFAPLSGADQAQAATKVKPMLSVAGKTYYNKQTAKSSAVGRWEKKAVIMHGFEFSKWEKAKKTGYNCSSKFHQGNGKKLWTCKANGKPVANVQMCTSGKVRAKWYHPNEVGARAGVRDAWEKLAAAEFGIKYSFYKNAKNKHATCGKDSNHPGKITCTLSATACK